MIRHNLLFYLPIHRVSLGKQANPVPPDKQDQMATKDLKVWGDQEEKTEKSDLPDHPEKREILETPVKPVNQDFLDWKERWYGNLLETFFFIGKRKCIVRKEGLHSWETLRRLLAEMPKFCLSVVTILLGNNLKITV